VGDSSDKNDKTQLLSDSQVLEVKPSPTKPPKLPVDDKNDRSVWKGVVVGADDFAPPAQSKSSGPSSIVLVILALAVLGGGGYLAWTKLRSQPAAAPDAAKAVAIDAMPQDAAPVAVPSATPDAVIDAVIAVPDAASIDDAGVEDASVTPDAGGDAGVKPIRRKYRPKRLEKNKAH